MNICFHFFRENLWLKLLGCGCLETVEHSDRKLQLPPLCIHDHLHREHAAHHRLPTFPSQWFSTVGELETTHACEMWNSSNEWVWLESSWPHLSWNCTRVQDSFYQSFLPSLSFSQVSDLHHGLKAILTIFGSHPFIAYRCFPKQISCISKPSHGMCFLEDLK